MIIIPAGVAIAVVARRNDLEWPRKGLEGLTYAAAVALFAFVLFVVFALLVNNL